MKSVTSLTQILSPLGTKNAGQHQSDVSFTGVMTPLSTSSFIVWMASFLYRSGTHLALRTFYGVAPGSSVMCIGLSVFIGSGFSSLLSIPGNSPTKMSLNSLMLPQFCILTLGSLLVLFPS